MKLVGLFLFVLIIQTSVAPPAPVKKTSESDKKSEEHSKEEKQNDPLDVEYAAYLKEIVTALETDPEFKQKMEKAEEVDFRNGKVASDLQYVNHHVRTKLDELKRIEIQRLTELHKRQMEIDGKGIEPPEHLDHYNPHSFEPEDLQKLINKVSQDLSEADRKRREEFKEYELQKHFEEEQMLNAIQNESDKEAFKKEIEERKKKHSKHEPLHSPGSKAQLEEVWKEEDHMDQELDPKAFFLLHDLNGDKVWDIVETKALFKKELDKMYQSGVPEDDMKEREEEMERMREYVFQETDLNKDKLISYEEFLKYTQKEEFKKDKGWEPLDQQEIYTPEEYKAFEQRRMEEIQRLIEQGRLPAQPAMPPPGHHIPQHYAHQYQLPPGYHPQGIHPQQMQYQQMHPQMTGQGMHPQQVQYQQMHHPQMGGQGVHHQQAAYHQQMAYQQQGQQMGQQQQGQPMGHHQGYQGQMPSQGGAYPPHSGMNHPVPPPSGHPQQQYHQQPPNNQQQGVNPPQANNQQQNVPQQGFNQQQPHGMNQQQPQGMNQPRPAQGVNQQQPPQVLNQPQQAGVNQQQPQEAVNQQQPQQAVNQQQPQQAVNQQQPQQAVNQQKQGVNQHPNQYQNPPPHAAQMKN